MPTNLPVCASGSRELKRPRPRPAAVRRACLLMVYGGDDGKPLDFIAAARLCNIRPNIMRKWPHRAEVQVLLRAERKAFRSAINCANEASLRDIRDHADNSMARVASVRALEALDEVDSTHRRGTASESPYVTIKIVNAVNAAPAPAPVTTIDAQHDADGFRIDRDDHSIDETGRRIFTPPSF